MTPLSPADAAGIADGIYGVLEKAPASMQSRPRRSSSLSGDGTFQSLLDSFEEEPLVDFEQYGFGIAQLFDGYTGYGGSRTPSGFGAIAEGSRTQTMSSLRARETLIAIRGTATKADWITDAKLGNAQFLGHRVHQGFVDTFESFRPVIDEYLDTAQPGQVHCVGHSLGGALASLTAAHIKERSQSCDVKLYTFGAPRVGMQGFAQQAESKIAQENIYRVYHDADVVSMVPMYPYLHTPSFDDGYQLKWNTALVSVLGHMMGSYISTIKNADWENLAGNRASVSTARVIEGFISTGLITLATAGSAPLLWMISKALQYILKKIAKLGIHASLPGYATTLDTLAWLLASGAAASLEVGGLVGGLIARIFQFLGKPLIKGMKITVAFVRWVLDKLYSMLRSVALNSLAAVPQIPEVSVSRMFAKKSPARVFIPQDSGLVGRAASRAAGPGMAAMNSRGPLGL